MKQLQLKTGLYFISLSFIFAFLISCGSSKIITEKFDGFSQGQPGEPINLKWKFKNATRVEIDKFPGKYYKPIDSMQAAFLASQTLMFNVIKADSTIFGSSDELMLPWDIKIAEKQAEPITRGPLEKNETKISSSSRPSSFMIGVNPDENARPERLKLLNVNFQKGAYLKAAILDENGNLTANSIAQEPSRWKILINSDDKIYSPQISDIKVSKFENSTNPTNLKIVVDYSAEATLAQITLAQIKKFSQVFKKNDDCDLTLFNQKILSNVKIHEQTEKAFQSIFDIIPSGLNASYKAVHKSLQTSFPKTEGSANALVLITQGNDNSSILYTAADCIALANQTNCPIYVVAIGDYPESYLFQPICDKTGGAYYSLDNNEIEKLADVLTEIYAGVNSYIQINFKPESIKEIEKQLSFNITVDYKANESTLNSSLLKTHMFMPPYPRYQAIATFAQNNAQIGGEYEENLHSLAEVLKDNPGHSIELIAHKRADEEDNVDKERSQKVWDNLFSKGVPAFNQIKQRSVGSKNPAAYYESEEWQKIYNRRVDIRWLQSDDMPFELALETEKSEELALKKVAQWEKRNYKAYFDRYISADGEPVYKIKLWGFKTIAEAEETAAKILKKFKVKSEIE